MWLEGIISKRDNRAAWRHGRTVPYTVVCRHGRWERFGFAGRNKRLLPFLLIGDVSVDAVSIDVRYGKRRVARGLRKSEKLPEKVTAGDLHLALPAAVHNNGDAGRSARVRRFRLTMNAAEPRREICRKD